MTTQRLRIGLNAGGGYLQGLNSVVAGAVLAADRLGWEVVGIRDGYDGLLVPENYKDGGLVELNRGLVPGLLGSDQGILGTAARNDPFRVRSLSNDNLVEEIDRSDLLLERIRAAGIDAVISIVGGSAIAGSNALNVAFKLGKKGLRTVCVPKSVENDSAFTALSLGYNSALSFTTETLERLRAGARDVHRVAVVEVLGHHAGWLALQSGMAVCADAILIPEVPYDLRKLGASLQASAARGQRPALVVVAEGIKTLEQGEAAVPAPEGLRKSLSPLSDARLGDGARVIEQSGQAAQRIAHGIQQLTEFETIPMALGQLLRAGPVSAVDRQLGIGFGAGAIRALEQGATDAMVVFQPPDLKFVPMAQAINRVRTVPLDSEFIAIARSIGISLGD